MGKNIETLVKDQELIARRHEQICVAALKLFSHKGFHQTSVREIALASNLSIGTLYSYIKTKEDVLHLVYKRILDCFQERMEAATRGIEDPTHQLRAALEATLRLYDEFRDVVQLLYQEGHALGREALQGLLGVDRRYASLFREILQRGNREGAFAVQEPDLVAVTILFLCSVWPLKRWNLLGYSLDDVIAHLSHLILHGIVRDGRPPSGVPSTSSGRSRDLYEGPKKP